MSRAVSQTKQRTDPHAPLGPVITQIPALSRGLLASKRPSKEHSWKAICQKRVELDLALVFELTQTYLGWSVCHFSWYLEIDALCHDSPLFAFPLPPLEVCFCSSQFWGQLSLAQEVAGRGMWLRDWLRLSSLSLTRSLSGSKEAAESNTCWYTKGFRSFVNGVGLVHSWAPEKSTRPEAGPWDT